MRRATPLLLAAAALAVGACNTYDPDLGAAPFRCGPDEPRCPLGYTCVAYSPEEQVCELPGAGGDDARADAGTGPFVCADDGELEPNNTTSEATNTFIPSVHDTYRLVGLSICPDSDEDYFLFVVDIAGKNLRADLTHQSSRGQLVLEVLNGDGTVIGTGQAVAGTPDVVRADVPNLPQGSYFARVRAPAGIENNYSIEIVVSGG